MVVALIDYNGPVGILINSITQNVTGSLFLTLLGIIFLVVAIALSLKIPMEFTMIFVFPLLIVCTFATTALLPVLGVWLIYLAILVSSYWWLN